MKIFTLSITACLLSLFGFSQNVPVDFEAGGYGATWTWTVFENSTNPSLQIIANPVSGGINTSSTVASFTALQAGNPWAGCETLHGADIGTFSLTPSTSSISIMVYKPVISDVGIKLVDAGGGSLGEIKVPNTVINQWEEITFDFSSMEGITYDQIVVFPDFDLGGRTQDNVCYFDNIAFGANSGGGGDLIITTEVCTPATEVRLTGPWWGWNPLGGPVAVDNGNGTWTFTLSPAPTADMEYLLVVDSVQENLIPEVQAGGTCAPITDGATYANRQWLTTDPLSISNTYNQCAACVTGPQDLIITTEVCTPATEVRLTGPWWGWNPLGGPVAVDNGNGTWTFTLSPAPTADMEYLLVVDSVQENLIPEVQAGGTCAPITDGATYANRQWLTTDPLSISNTYNQCSACAPADLVITTEVCTPATEVRLTGPWWGWDPLGGPVAVDNGNGTWTFTLSPAPTADMEYLLVVDSVQENLIAEMQAGGTCAPITDFATYANRQWLTTDPLMISNTYGQCGVCNPPADLIIITEVCDSASEVRMTGPFWGWDPFGGPTAVDNGNGTWTFTLSPAPTADMEYLLVVDSVQENLIQEMVNGGTCAPVTDFATYANRQWLTTDTLVINNVYGQCGPCSAAADLLITVEVCDPATEVRMTGPFWNWDPFGGPVGVDNGNGTWTFTLSPAPSTDMEYLFVVDSVQENLIQDMQYGGDCAPVTDYFSYANRLWTVGSGDVTGDVYDRCVPCSYPDISITTEVCDSGATSVKLTGPIWNWDPNNGPDAVDNGDGTWTFTISPAPTDSFEYLLIMNGTQEDLIQDMIDGGTCAPITDYATYASRLWEIGDGPVSNVYGQCGPCLVGVEDYVFNNLTVYPVPADNVIFFTNDANIDRVVLYSMVGSIITDKSVNATNGQLDVSSLASGIYYLKVMRGDVESVRQIVVE